MGFTEIDQGFVLYEAFMRFCKGLQRGPVCWAFGGSFFARICTGLPMFCFSGEIVSRRIFGDAVSVPAQDRDATRWGQSSPTTVNYG